MGSLHLSSLINSKLVFLKSPLKDVREIYSFMLHQVSKLYPIKMSLDNLINYLVDRKLDEGILFPTGTAIPHLHIDNYNDTVISVLVPEKTLHTQNGEIKIFVMVLTGKHDNALYLHILQSVVQMSKDEELYKKVQKAKTPQDFLAHLKSSDFAVRRAINVSDIMTTQIISVKKDATLQEVSYLFYKHNYSYFIVVDDKGKAVGEITILDYMMAGVPAYTTFLKNLYFMKSLEPFERLIKEEGNIKVSAVMKPIEVTVSPDTTIFKAVFLMNKHKKTDIPVLDKDKLVGIASIDDIFKKVIKG
jgi:CBS domain-containing protein